MVVLYATFWRKRSIYIKRTVIYAIKQIIVLFLLYLSEEILAWIIRHGLAVPTGTYAGSGYCRYPEYRFRPERLQEIDPEGYCVYLHDWKKRYGS